MTDRSADLLFALGVARFVLSYRVCEVAFGFNPTVRPTYPKNLEIDGIGGVVEMVDCVRRHPSQWFCGYYGWVLKNPQRLPFRESSRTG